MPNNIGSVGKAKLKSNPGIISLRGTEKGTSANVNRSNLSSAKKANSKINNTKGKKLNSVDSWK